MNREDVEKLLGGYAAGTLTADERQALFEAALEDQQLFESLAAEEPLRELLQDTAVRAQLLAALEERPASWYRRLLVPALGTAAAAAMLMMAFFVRYERPKPEPVVVAETRRLPVRSFQPPLPVEIAALPTKLPPKALPSPPALPATAAPARVSLDTLTAAAPSIELQKSPVPQATETTAAVIAQTAEAKPQAPVGAPSSEAKQAAEAKTALGAQAAGANTDAVGPVAAAPPPRVPAFRSLTAAAGGVAAGAGVVDSTLRFTVYEKSQAGDLSPIDPRVELDRADEVVIRFESIVAGSLSIAQLDSSGAETVLATESLQPSVPYTFPSSGALRANAAGRNDLLVRFTRQPVTALKSAESEPGQPGTPPRPARSAPAQPAPAPIRITLRYR